MRILIISERFSPSVGGVQAVTRLLGQALARAGHRVTVVTSEAGGEMDGCGFGLSRRPMAMELLRQYRSADAIILQGLPVRLGWPLLLRRSKALAVHHLQPPVCETNLRVRLRAKLAGRVRHAAVSGALARQLPWPAEAILSNPYDDEIFRHDQTVARSRDVIFVGRLIPQKGVPVLLEALALLRQRGLLLTATVVGEGPERSGLAAMLKSRKLEHTAGSAACTTAKPAEVSPSPLPKGRGPGRGVLSCSLSLGPLSSVEFAGQITGRALAQLLTQHRLMVVPSVYQEPFGVVALEAIACGCVVIGSDAGGLPQAIGPCGTTFPLGNAASLAAKIQDLLGSFGKREEFRAAAEPHLSGHRPEAVARKYLQVLQRGPWDKLRC